MNRGSFRVYFHQEEDGVWAESPEAPGFTAVAATIEELERQIVDGLRFWMDDDRADLVIYMEGPSTVSSGSEVYVAADVVGFTPEARTQFPATSSVDDLEVKVPA